MFKKSLLVLSLMFSFIAVALAADVTGKWTAQVPGRDGATREQTFTLKQDADKLTGTTTGMGGAEVEIAEGKVAGDTVSFVVSMDRGGQVMKMTYTGTVAGDEIKFKREAGQGPAREFVAKKAK